MQNVIKEALVIMCSLFIRGSTTHEDSFSKANEKLFHMMFTCEKLFEKLHVLLDKWELQYISGM